MQAAAHKACTDTIRVCIESWFWEKIPCLFLFFYFFSEVTMTQTFTCGRSEESCFSYVCFSYVLKHEKKIICLELCIRLLSVISWLVFMIKPSRWYWQKILHTSPPLPRPPPPLPAPQQDTMVQLTWGWKAGSCAEASGSPHSPPLCACCGHGLSVALPQSPQAQWHPPVWLAVFACVWRPAGTPGPLAQALNDPAEPLANTQTSHRRPVSHPHTRAKDGKHTDIPQETSEPPSHQSKGWKTFWTLYPWWLMLCNWIKQIQQQ